MPGPATAPAAARRARCWRTAATLAAIVAVGACALAVGVTRALPFSPEIDEPTFVGAAVHIAATGDLNPHWLGHPGATVIYPLALVFRIQQLGLDVLADGAPAPSPRPSGDVRPAVAGGDLQARFAAAPAEFYLLGRFLSIAYELLAIPLAYLVGSASLGRRAGLIGAWLTALLPIGVAHAQVVRSDSAAMFFGLLSLWLCVRIPRADVASASAGATDTLARSRAVAATVYRRVALAGLAVGLAIASRYFMVALVPVLLGAVAGRRRSAPPRARGLALAIAAVAVGFACASPYALLDPAELRRSLAAEAESSHIGADGLSPPGNLAWYVSQALPADLTWPVALLAGAGMVLMLRRRAAGAWLLVGYVALHLVLISASALHWHRWTIQILPVLALCCGYAVDAIGRRIARRGLGAVVAGLTSIQLAAQLLVYDLQQLQPPARVVARGWLQHNLAAGTLVPQEWYGPPLEGTGLRTQVRFSLSEQPLASYSGTYVVASSAVYDRYFREPARYPDQVRFYETLFARATSDTVIRATFEGDRELIWLAGGECSCALHPTRGTPVIRILRPA